MKFKRIISLILCIVLLVLTLAGCGDPDPDCSYPDCGPDSPAHIDFERAIRTFPPGTAMMTSGDLKMTWAEFYIIVFSTFQSLLESYGIEIPWDDDHDGITLAELALEYATNEAMAFFTYVYGLEDTGFSLSDQELAEFHNDMAEYIAESGGKEAFEKYLRENGGFYDFDTFEQFLLVEYTVGVFVDGIYGEGGSAFPDESVAEYASENDMDLLMALHILLFKDEDDNDAPRLEIEAIHTDLNAQIGSADFVDIFKDHIMEYSDDFESLDMFPNGYLFLPEAMVPEFSDATLDLEIGEMSGIVETEYGFHIILRLPVDYDNHLLTRDGESPGTFRQLAAASQFDLRLADWHDSLELSIAFTSEYDSIDLSDIFRIHRFS